MDVSIIIVNYHTSKLINNCIESIFKFTKEISYEVIIVDNGSEDLSRAIKWSDDPRINLVQLSENIGFGKANNAGVRIARGRNLFLLNPDTLLLNNAIKILSDFIDQHDNCGVCGGNLYDENLLPIHSFRRCFPSILWELNELSNYKLERLIFGKNAQFNYSEKPLEVAYITGADLMITKSLFHRLTGFAEEFFMYYEETDLCKRVRNNKYVIMSVPAAKIQHLEGKSYNGENKNVSFNYFRWNSIFTSMIIYYRKHHNRVYTYLSFKIAYLTLFVKSCLGSSKNKQIFKVYKAILKKQK